MLLYFSIVLYVCIFLSIFAVDLPCDEEVLGDNEGNEIEHECSQHQSEIYFVDKRKTFLERRNHRRIDESQIDMTDEEFDEIVYGNYEGDPLQVDWEREIKLLNWRQNPSFLSKLIQERANHPFDQTRRCLNRMVHKGNSLNINDCFFVDVDLLRSRNKKISMQELTLNQWEHYDSRKSKNEVIRKLKSCKDEPRLKHSILIEFHPHRIDTKLYSICEIFLYWISYEVQKANCILITSNFAIFEMKSEYTTKDDDDKRVIDYLSKFDEVKEIFWRGLSSDHLYQEEIEYTDEQHFFLSIFHRRNKNRN